MKFIYTVGGILAVIFSVSLLFAVRDTLPVWGEAFLALALVSVVAAIALYGHRFFLQTLVGVEARKAEAFATRNAATFAPTTLGGSVTIYDRDAAFYAPATINANVPQSITYAPHNAERAINAPAILPQLGEPEVAQSVPTFAQLLAQNALPIDKLLFGIKEDGTQEIGTWKKLYSPLVSGISGSGKTVTASFLAAQAALAGAQFVIVDPHQDAGDEGLAAILAPLSSRFVCSPAGRDEDELTAAIAIARNEMHKRLDGDPARTPFIFAIDELMSLMRGPMKDEIAGLLMDIAQEGRKVNLFAMALGQMFKGSTTGGTEVRDSFASTYVHRMKPNQARMLLPADEARLVGRLQVGQVLLYDTHGAVIPLAIPLTTRADLTTVSRIINDTPTTSKVPYVPEKSLGSRQNVVDSDSTTTASQSAKARSAEEVRILDLFANGSDIAAIVKEIYGDVQGATATKYRVSVQAVIRDFMRDQYGSAAA